MPDIVEEIARLKRERSAAILAHNYQRPEVQDVADHVGDSLVLAKKAVSLDADVIVFCGVMFMAESAKILSPQKTVLIPDNEAMCPMAAMVDVEGLRMLKQQEPDAVVVAYVNTTAKVKAEVDVCCTSANAVNVIKGLDAEKIIFVPDTNLGLFVKRSVPDKEIILWPGYCPTHQNITAEQIREARQAHPGAYVMVHPECTPDVIDEADGAYSTEGMIRFAQASEAGEFVVGTEREHAYRLRKVVPGKAFYPLERAVCPNMKKITLEKVLASLKEMKHEVVLSDELLERARIPLERMVAVGRGD